MTARAAALLALALLLAAPPAPAESLPPEYFQVTALAADDPLAVRAKPSAEAESLGALPGGAGPIEVVATRMAGQTEWAQILWDERPGWVAARYLEPIEPERLGRTALPVGLVCSGTEPFWALTLQSQSEADWLVPLLDERAERRIGWALGAGGRQGWPAAIRFSDAAGEDAGVMIVRPGLCSDGMSDRDYGWLAAFQTYLDGQPAFFEGCCRLPRREPGAE